MATGWVLDGGTWYYATGSGALARGPVSVGGVPYCFDARTGAMLTGYQTDAQGVRRVHGVRPGLHRGDIAQGQAAEFLQAERSAVRPPVFREAFYLAAQEFPGKPGGGRDQGKPVLRGHDLFRRVLGFQEIPRRQRTEQQRVICHGTHGKAVLQFHGIRTEGVCGTFRRVRSPGFVKNVVHMNLLFVRIPWADGGRGACAALSEG